METFVGYLDNQSHTYDIASDSFCIHCAGRYRLINRESFVTTRPVGSKNFQLLFVSKGKAYYKVNDVEYELVPGDTLLYSPYEPQDYYYYKKDNPTIYWVHFSTGLNGPSESLGNWRQSHLKVIDYKDEFELLFTNLINSLQLQAPFFHEESRLLMQQLMILMSRTNQNYNNIDSTSQEVNEAIEYFHKHPEDNFSIKDYTKKRKLNYYRFIDSFSKQTGLSPRQYIIRIRMNIAKELLSNPNLNISEIAQLIGYDNPLYFSRLFKKYWGRAPKTFR